MRKSGILMHISSLPSPYGIGSMGKCAYDFVDFLHDAGQSYWQILPLSPTGYANSPYRSFSAFAGNHYLIDLDLLIDEGLLTQEEVNGIRWYESEERVDFGTMYTQRNAVLRTAYERFVPNEVYADFIKENRYWLEDYALFMALKESFRGRHWQNWSVSLLMRIAPVLETYRQELKDAIEFHYFLQYKFFVQWRSLRAYANSRGVRIIGDVPIYVPLDSADVWSNPYEFQLNRSRRPTVVAGSPPDAYNPGGQRWGNALYDWDRMKEDGYGWWIRRLRFAARMYDVVRLDHFRGFESYWAVPAEDETAENGVWRKGPGMDFLGTVRTALPKLQIIAEDLGNITDEVETLRRDAGYPGMKVLQFTFDSREQENTLPADYPANSVCYSGTHDHMPLKGWLEDAAAEDVENAWNKLGLKDDEGPVRGMIRSCMASGSDLCIIQMQDYLELGAASRMNWPGMLLDENWTWRAKQSAITPALARQIRAITQCGGRI